MKKSLLLPLLLLPVLGTVSCSNESSSSEESSRDVYTLPTEDGFFDYVDAAGNEYHGDFKNGLYDGFGTILYADGTSYIGTFVEGIRDGSGTIYWNTGCVYIGEMKNDAMHGDGYMSWPMGDYYQGKWKNGQPNGYGTKCFLRDATGETYRESYDTYVGYMVNGLMDGVGIMTYSFGGVFDGHWKEGIRFGQGRYIWEETEDPEIPWKMFEGNFHDWISGAGTLYFKDGTFVTGTFDGNSLPHSVAEYQG